jgi:tetratricopeptide (TPR) repeat protein
VRTRQIGDNYLLARALTNLGYLYTELGYWYRAEVFCCRALPIFRKCGRAYGWAHAENHLGILYSRLGLWAQAEYHLEEACSIWKQSRDDHGLLRGYINFSLLYLKREQPEQALLYLKQAHDQAEQTGDLAERGVIYTNMAIAYRLQGNKAMSEELHRQAEAVYRQQSNLEGLARVWGNLGMLYVQQEDWSAAVTYLNQSLQMWQKLGNRLGEIETLLSLIAFDIARQQPQPGLQRLMEVEVLLKAMGGAGRHHPYRDRLEDYRRRLTGNGADQTAAD